MRLLFIYTVPERAPTKALVHGVHHWCRTPVVEYSTQARLIHLEVHSGAQCLLLVCQSRAHAELPGSAFRNSEQIHIRAVSQIITKRISVCTHGSECAPATARISCNSSNRIVKNDDDQGKVTLTPEHLQLQLADPEDL